MMLIIQRDNNDCRNKDNNDDGKRDADNDGDDVGDGYEDDKKIHLVLLCPEACRMGIRPTEMLFSKMNYYNISKIITIIVIVVVSTILPGPSSNLGDAKKKILPNPHTLSLFPLGQYNALQLQGNIYMLAFELDDIIDQHFSAIVFIIITINHSHRQCHLKHDLDKFLLVILSEFPQDEHAKVLEEKFKVVRGILECN